MIPSEGWRSTGGFANAMAVPLLVIAARRNPDLSVDLFVSRHVTFYTAALLAIILLSGSARSRARVFIAKHFYANRYDYRDEWLRLTATLEDERDDLGSRTVRALAQIVEAAGGVLWVRRERAGGEPRWEKLAGWHADGPDVLAPGDPLLDFMRRKRWSVQASGVASQCDNYESLVLPGWITAFGERARPCPCSSRTSCTGWWCCAIRGRAWTWTTKTSTSCAPQAARPLARSRGPLPTGS